MRNREKRISKAAMKRLLGSKFFREVKEVVRAWDYYISTGEQEMANEMMHKWFMIKEALEFITGNVYGFSRDGTTYSVVNERNYDDMLFIGFSIVPKEKEA